MHPIPDTHKKHFQQYQKISTLSGTKEKKHRVYRVPGSLFSRQIWVLPTPRPQESVAPPRESGGGDIFAREGGAGGHWSSRCAIIPLRVKASKRYNQKIGNSVLPVALSVKLGLAVM